MLYTIVISTLLATYVMSVRQAYIWNKEVIVQENFPDTIKERAICLAIAAAWPVIFLSAGVALLLNMIKDLFEK